MLTVRAFENLSTKWLTVHADQAFTDSKLPLRWAIIALGHGIAGLMLSFFHGVVWIAVFLSGIGLLIGIVVAVFALIRQSLAIGFSLAGWLTGLVAFVLLFFGFWLQADWILNYPVSRVNYERLHVGMTLRQAEEIIGKEANHWPPPRDLYDEIDADGQPVLAINDHPADPFRFWSNEKQFTPHGVHLEGTINDGHLIAIFLDPAGRVVGKSYMCAPDMSVRRWLGCLGALFLRPRR